MRVRLLFATHVSNSLFRVVILFWWVTIFSLEFILDASEPFVSLVTVTAFLSSLVACFLWVTGIRFKLVIG